MSESRLRIAALSLGALLFFLVLYRNAWMSDDAYISFRVVDNFVHGYGLRWNAAERVQAFTNPLWVLLLSAFYFFTREIYFTGIVLSIAVSLLAVVVILSRTAKRATDVLIGLLWLASSKSFIDYSVSGMENPLTHLLLAVFLFLYFSSEMDQTDRKKLFLLSLIASLGMVNRLDSVLIYFPMLGWALFRSREPRRWVLFFAGMFPFLLWEAFAVFYYGSPLPNTYAAKLKAGVPEGVLALQGLRYLFQSLKTDPITGVTIAAGLTLPFFFGGGRNGRGETRAAACAIGLYLLYVIKAGGDFMAGRFLTAPFLAAFAVVFGFLSPRLKMLAGGVLIAAAFLPHSPLRSGADYGKGRTNLIDRWGIADERAFYYPSTGLLTARGRKLWPDYPLARKGRMARAKGETVVRQNSVGFFGFYAGPGVHVLDADALCDPLRARLPVTTDRWRIGHFTRDVPEGYFQTLQTGRNFIVDPSLASYYDRLMIVTRGSLWSLGRLAEIWNFNTGKYDALLEDYLRSGEGIPWDDPRNPRLFP